MFECKCMEVYGDDWFPFKTGDPEEAAKMMAEMIYDDDPCNAENFEIEIEVRPDHDRTDIETYLVSAEAIIRFYARQKFK